MKGEYDDWTKGHFPRPQLTHVKIVEEEAASQEVIPVHLQVFGRTMGPILRWIGSISAGLVVSWLVVAAVSAGMQQHFKSVSALPEVWGVFLWGGHWIWRTVSSVAALSIGAAIAALGVREKGQIAGALVAFPGAMAWAIVAYLVWSGQTDSHPLQAFAIHGGAWEAVECLGNKVIPGILALIMIPIGFFVGGAVSPLEPHFSENFDQRRWAIFGMRWYQYLWLLPVAYVSLAISANAAPVILALWETQSDSGGISLMRMISGLFLMGWFFSMFLLWVGLSSAYQLLAGLEDQDSSVGLSALKFGCGFPLLAIAVQIVMGLINIGIARLAG